MPEERRLARQAISWVAGVKAPAFIERTRRESCTTLIGDSGGVAGVKAPAFIERCYDEWHH